MPAATDGVYALGSRVELFVDDEMIDAMDGLRLRMHSPRLAEVAVGMDRPYEDSTLYDPVVILDDGRYRMWYRTNFNAEPFYTGYAESADGVHWEKPSVSLIEFAGSKDNNLVWSSAIDSGKPRVLSVFKDPTPGCPDSQRYKAVCMVDREGGYGLRALVSPDGLRWQSLRQEPILTDGYFDSHNIALYDEARGCYVAYYREFRNGIRHIKRATSQDYLHWTAGEFIDLGDSPEEQLYKNAATPYYRRPDLMLMFPKRFVEEREAPGGWELPGLSDIVLMTSRDGFHFRRTFMEAFLRPGLDGQNWHERAIEAGPNLVPTGDGEMSLYIVEHYRAEDVRIRRAVLRQDGLVSLHAEYAGGEVVTRPFTYSGSRLVLNLSTSAVGSIRVELQDAAGKPLPGRGLSSCPEIYGDELARTVVWEGGHDVGPWAGQAVRLRVAMRDADLYSLRFVPR